MTDNILSIAIDDFYEPSLIECTQCKEGFYFDVPETSSVDDRLLFCSEACRIQWDEENSWEILEERNGTC